MTDETEYEQQEHALDAAQEVVTEDDRQIETSLAMKVAGEKSGNREMWNEARSNLDWLYSQRAKHEAERQGIYRIVEAARRERKLTELDEHRSKADLDAAKALINQLAIDAAEHAKAIDQLRYQAQEVATEQREHAAEVRALAHDLGLVTAAPSLSEPEVDTLFDARTRAHKELE